VEEKKDNRAIPFFIGLFFGWCGVKVVTHLVYITIILTLITLLVFKK
jgi:hypothetical protein